MMFSEQTIGFDSRYFVALLHLPTASASKHCLWQKYTRSYSLGLSKKIDSEKNISKKIILAKPIADRRDKVVCYCELMLASVSNKQTLYQIPSSFSRKAVFCSRRAADWRVVPCTTKQNLKPIGLIDSEGL